MQDDKKIGIVGCGAIGAALKKWLENYNLNCSISVSDPPKGFNDDLKECDAIFISIHIPTESDNTQNLYLLKQIIKTLPDKPIFIRTTLLPGTCDKLSHELNKKIYFMPEFLTERTAYNDFCKQPMIFTGEIELLKKIFIGKQYIVMSSVEAEIAKYAHNVFGAMKVTYFNGIYEIAEKTGCNYENIKDGILLSGYINKEHTSVPGPDGKFGYGGKCFPKDVAAFIDYTKNTTLHSILIEIEKNNEHYRINNESDKKSVDQMNKIDTPIFSVIIPTYNREKTILRSIKSVLNQTFYNLELIVVDDGSEDNTKQIISDIKDKRLRYILQNNAGSQVARNTGIMNSKGIYVSFLDSDDEWNKTMLEKVYEKFLSDSEINCVYTRAISVDENGNNTFGAPEFNLEGFIYTEALKQGYIASMITLTVKKTCFEKIGVFDTSLKLCQDDDICFRLARYYKFGLVREDLAYAHGDGGNQMTNNRRNYANGWFVFWQKYEKKVLEHCGKKTMTKHYFKCLDLFFEAKDTDSIKTCLKKIFENYNGILARLYWLQIYLSRHFIHVDFSEKKNFYRVFIFGINFFNIKHLC